jgi:hypothetical protein
MKNHAYEVPVAHTMPDQRIERIEEATPLEKHVSSAERSEGHAVLFFFLSLLLPPVVAAAEAAPPATQIFTVEHYLSTSPSGISSRIQKLRR